MTNKEIFEAEELVRGIECDLTNINVCTVGRMNVAELVARVLEAAPRMFDSFNRLVSHRPTIFESESDRDTVYDGLHEIFFRSTQPQEIQSWMRDRDWARISAPAREKAVAELAELMTPEYKKKLIDVVKTQAHRVFPVLSKTYRDLQALWVNAPMTNDEILEAQKLIAHMRNDLTVLTSTTDAEKLTALVHEKAMRMIGSLGRLRRRHRSTVLVSVDDLSRFQNGLAVMIAMAEMAERRPDYKAKLIEAVTKYAPIVDAILDKVAQVIRDPALSPLAINQKKMAEVAQAILDGRVGVIAGARQIHDLCCGHYGLDESDPDIRTFVGIESETDDLPIGEVRQYWAPDALAKKDAEIARCEALHRQSALDAATHLVARFT